VREIGVHIKNIKQEIEEIEETEIERNQEAVPRGAEDGDLKNDQNLDLSKQDSKASIKNVKVQRTEDDQETEIDTAIVMTEEMIDKTKEVRTTKYLILP
jgi:hypothetical protein